MHIGVLVTWAAVSIAATAPAVAATRIQTGVGPGGMTWTATSNVVGQTSTGTTPPRGSPGGGDPIYLAPNDAGYSGVVGVRMTYASGRNLVCSGSLVGDRSVVTAGHCVSDGGGAVSDSLVRTQVFFQNAASSERDERVFGMPSGNPSSDVTVIDVSNYVVNAGYTGNVVDQNDIAVLTLADIAPAFAQRYDIYTANLSGMAFNVTGYGARSDVGGAEGVRPPAGTATGYRRQGDNVYDFIRNAIASAVPEPATWAQLLLGFGMIGVATRRRRRSVAVAWCGRLGSARGALRVTTSDIRMSDLVLRLQSPSSVPSPPGRSPSPTSGT